MENELPETGAIPYYAVSGTKLVLLTVVTMGLFEWVWFYKNWKIHRARYEEDISPFWRAFFCGFTCFSFFERVRGDFLGKKLEFKESPALLGAPILLSGPLSKLPGLFFLLAFVSVIPMFIVNKKLAYYNGTVCGVSAVEERISILQWALILFGICLLGFAVAGALTP